MWRHHSPSPNDELCSHIPHLQYLGYSLNLKPFPEVWQALNWTVLRNCGMASEYVRATLSLVHTQRHDIWQVTWPRFSPRLLCRVSTWKWPVSRLSSMREIFYIFLNDLSRKLRQNYHLHTTRDKAKVFYWHEASKKTKPSHCCNHNTTVSSTIC